MTGSRLAEGTLPDRRARVGFLGVGWIGRHRMEHMLATGRVEAVAIVDPSAQMIADAQQLAPAAEPAADLDALLNFDLDGIAIATPSALHSAQTVALSSAA